VQPGDRPVDCAGSGGAEAMPRVSKPPDAKPEIAKPARGDTRPDAKPDSLDDEDRSPDCGQKQE
jgi:hypothetical protein